ncbi:Hypothetical predicted protein [Mytilus galloprovincialis]|uniref:Reverse transcriptase domain-containing protein n=1 Tax=Mytilus galloprovincialis TaxID=29158 RepID=A0A8B6HI41_MYTGA|nr:Hypothetical predicted protein [Mytilus galloprovincialis]
MVANVTSREKVMVPPNSVMKLSCQVNCEMPSHIVEAGIHSGLLVPRTLHAGGSQPVVCLINTSDKHVHVRQGELIAQAVKVETIEVPAKVRVVGNRWYSKLDANSAYWQVKIKKEDRSKTAFISKYGLFEFARMAFGLCNAQATYARVISLVLRGLTWDIVLAFIDDILVLGKDIASHLANLRAVLQRFKKYGLKLKPKKCELFQEQVEFLGRVVSRKGMNIGPDYIEDVKKWPTLHNTKTVDRFLGFANYHRDFIEGYSKIAAPLQDVTGKRSFTWGKHSRRHSIYCGRLSPLHPYWPCRIPLIHLS